MLKMDQVFVIRHKVLVEGLSMRQVAKQMGMSRNTVKKYLGQSEPKYEASAKRPDMICYKIGPRIEQLLEEWSSRVTAKQKITGRRILRQLREEGFTTGLTSVLKCLKEHRRKKAEVFVPLVHRAGDEAQVAFLDGHVRAFEHFNGVPARCALCSNLQARSNRIVGAAELSGRFLALTSHYIFEPCFARIATAHDKAVLRLAARVSGGNFTTPIPGGETLGAISQFC
jgi:prepilin-type processing-associated H-X9-DG protein